eukprot:TRINITY_DN120710_c0_g1_i1.p1 TRINITY_DN120710_c0_g1~~TRINITY_DN120710_c0_g1_i1.p1  ORF type:complete len:1032 (+),score=341.46 TRINITY_DN120710_c0_g1_i1:136-3231(+)
MVHGKSSNPPSPASTRNAGRMGKMDSLPTLQGGSPKGQVVTKMSPSSSAPSLGPPPQHLVSMLRRQPRTGTAMYPSAGGQEGQLGVGPSPRRTSIPGDGSKKKPLDRPPDGTLLPPLQNPPAAPSNVDYLNEKVGKELKLNLRDKKDDMSIAWARDGSLLGLEGQKEEIKSPTQSARNHAASVEIKSAARKVCESIDSVNKDVENFVRKQAMSKAKPVSLAAMEDPVLVRAREVADMAKTKYSRQWNRNEQSDDAPTLKTIFSTSKGITDSLNEVLDNLWRSRVRTSRPQDDPDAWMYMYPAEEEDDPDSVKEDDGPRKIPVAAEEVEGLPNLAERLANVDKRDQGFSPQEIARIRTAYTRFKQPGSWDLHKDNLIQLLNYLGHVMTRGEGFWPLYEATTTYDYIDFEEFIGYMERYLEYERRMFKDLFNQFDEDGSGEMSMQELRALTAHLGITPMMGMMKEAFEMVDQDGNEELDFNQYIKFLVVYRHCEGFTRAEVKELRKVFDRLADDEKGNLPVDSLCDALVRVFGMQCEEPAEALVEEITKNPSLDGHPPENLLFSEFLIFARRSREMQHTLLAKKHGLVAEGASAEEAMKAAFAANDADGSGGMSVEEIRVALKEEGYEPLNAVIKEIWFSVVEESFATGRELDFDEFFEFQLIFKTRDGFLLKEIDELLWLYKKFDEEGDEEIGSIQLADIFRYLGYTLSMEEVSHYVTKVDVNGTDSLDPREFLQLMQMHRKTEVINMEKAYKNFKQGDRIPKLALPAALDALKQQAPDDVLASIPQSGCNFDEFVVLVDNARSKWVAQQRKKAGFNDAEIEHFEEMFNRFDKDKSGDIDVKELMVILQAFGWAPKSKEERDSIVVKLDKARAAAAEAGVEECSDMGGGELTLWEFIQLCRLLQREREEAEEKTMQMLMTELSFSLQEVDSFRQVFNEWINKDQEGGAASRNAAPATRLSRDLARRFLRSLGIKFDSAIQAEFDQKFSVLQDDSNKLDFSNFLRMMKWVLQTNLGGINGEGDKKKDDEKEGQ